jgi:hypothetical protein
VNVDNKARKVKTVKLVLKELQVQGVLLALKDQKDHQDLPVFLDLQEKQDW